MSALRLFSFPAHTVVEMLGGIGLMAAPFALGFGPAGTVIGFALGVLVVGLAIADTISIAAHLAVDQALVAAFLAAAIALALAADRAAAVVFLAAALVQLVLTATTRYTRPLGAH